MFKLVDELKFIRDEKRITKFVCYFNDGQVGFDSRSTGRNILWAFTNRPIEDIKTNMIAATRSYINDCDFDRIEMYLRLGLVYNSNDINEDNSIKENALPYDGIVRFYPTSFKSYLDDKQTNEIDYARYGYNKEGYVRYNALVKAMNRSGLKYSGPESFDELKERILNNEEFDIKVVASLTKNKEQNKPKENKTLRLKK